MYRCEVLPLHREYGVAGDQNNSTTSTPQLAPSTPEKPLKSVEMDTIKRTRFFTLCYSRNQAILWLKSVKEKILLRAMDQDICPRECHNRPENEQFYFQPP